MNFEGKKVLITGGAGLAGSNLIKRLIPTGAIITATWLNKLPAKHTEVFYLQCDLNDKRDCENAVFGADYVFMMAAVKAGAGVMSKNPLPLFAPNVRIYLNTIEAAYEAGVKKVLFLGSSTAYPENEEAVVEDEMFQGDPWDKYFLVGWHKRIGEKICQIYSEKITPRMPCVVLRPTNIYGPGDDFNPESSHVAASLIRKAVEKHDPLEVWGDGSEVRDLIYVDDLIDAILLAMDKIDGYDPINIGCGTGVSVTEILKTIMNATGFHPEVIFNPSKPTMIPKRLVSIEKAKKLLGWTPKTTLPEGIGKTMEWYRGQK